jgi:hypothetical protein
MITKLIVAVALTATLFSCNSSATKTPVTDTDVATTFIRAVLDNDFITAEKYLLNDEANQQYFKSFQQQYKLNPKTELEKYKAADIIVNTLTPLGDSVTIINYSNSYKKEVKKNIKLVRSSGKWLIDFKYTFAVNE